MDKGSLNRVLKNAYISSVFSRLGISYWINDEYLVEEYSDLYSNYCKKVEISKIQAFTCVKTISNAIIVVCLLIPIIIMVLLMISFGADWGVGLYIAIGLTAIPVAVVVLILRQGSSCEVYLHTAVGSRELVGIKNMVRAKKFFNTVNEYVRKSQGDIDVEGVIANIEEAEKIISRVAVLNKIRNRKKVNEEVK